MGNLFSKRLDEARIQSRLKWKDLAEAAGVTAGYISKLKSGSQDNLSRDKLLKLSQRLNVDLDWLLGGETPGGELSQEIANHEIKAVISGAERGRLVKVASWAQAGEVTDYEQIPDDWQESIATDCPDADAVAVELRGDSMLPIYQAGDCVVMMPSREPRTGCLVVAKLRDEGVCFKLYAEPSRGIIRLSSYNEAYSPFERRRDDFEWICPVFETRRNVWR